MICCGTCWDKGGKQYVLSKLPPYRERARQNDMRRLRCQAAGGNAGAAGGAGYGKDKGFSYFYYKEIKTEVSLTDTAVNITQTNTWFAFFKRPPAKITIPYEELQGVEIYRSWDFWDMLFAVLITVISQMRHWTWFLLVLLFLYTAAGRVIAIHYKDGAVWRIPIDALGKHHRAEAFMEELRKHIPGEEQ